MKNKIIQLIKFTLEKINSEIIKEDQSANTYGIEFITQKSKREIIAFLFLALSSELVDFEFTVDKRTISGKNNELEVECAVFGRDSNYIEITFKEK